MSSIKVVVTVEVEIEVNPDHAFAYDYEGSRVKVVEEAEGSEEQIAQAMAYEDVSALANGELAFEELSVQTVAVLSTRIAKS